VNVGLARDECSGLLVLDKVVSKEISMRDINGNNNKNYIFENGNTINGDNGIIANTIVLINGEKKEAVQYEIVKGKFNLSWKFAIATSGSFSLVSLLGVVSSIITIFQSFKFSKLLEYSEHTILGLSISSWSYICTILFVSTSIIAITLLRLKRKRIISVLPNSIFSKHLGLFNDGKIGFLKLKSKCHITNCGGTFRFEYNLVEDKYYFVCKRNPSQHRFEFDFTELIY
jgi:hypothetical protein